MLMEKYNNLVSSYSNDEDVLEIIKDDMGVSMTTLLWYTTRHT